MARGYRSLIWLAVIGGGLGAAYAGLPAILTAVATQALTAQGLQDVRLSLARPGWEGVRVHDVHFSTDVSRQRLGASLHGIEIGYRIPDLIHGRLGNIRIDGAELRQQPTATSPGGAASADGHAPSDSDALAGPSLSTLLPGLLPKAWLSRLPFDALWLTQLSADGLAPDGRRYHAEASLRLDHSKAVVEGGLTFAERLPGRLRFSLSMDDTNQARLSLARLDTPLGEAAAELISLHITPVADTADRLAAAGSLTLNLGEAAPYLEPWFGLQTRAPRLQGRLHSTWQMDLPASAIDSGDLLALHLQSDNALQLSSAGIGEDLGRSEAHLSLAVALEQGQVNWRLAKGAQLSTTLKAGAGPLQGQRIALRLPAGLGGRLSRQHEAISLRLPKGARVQALPIKTAELALPTLELALSADADIRYEPGSGRLRGDALSLTLTGSPLQRGDDQLMHDGIDLQLSRLSRQDAAWQLQGTLAARAVRGRLQGHALPATQLSADIGLHDNTLDLSALAEAFAHAVSVRLTARHDIGTATGQADYSLSPLALGKSGISLKRLLGDWQPAPLNGLTLASGQLSAQGGLHWRRAEDGATAWTQPPALALQLQRLSGRYQELDFNGLNADVALTLDNGIATQREARITLDRLETGLPIEGIEIGLQFSQPQGAAQPLIELGRTRAHLLGGLVSSEPARLQPGSDNAPIIVIAEGLRLADIMRLEQEQGLEGSGLLDGRFPITLATGGISVQQGRLTARQPGGHIRYRPTDTVQNMARTNPSIKLITDALSDFQYHELEVISDYSPQGNLAMQVKLKGNNPLWQQGQPVHLNLNLEENIPTLLRSLRTADTLGNEVTERIRQGTEKKAH